MFSRLDSKVGIWHSTAMSLTGLPTKPIVWAIIRKKRLSEANLCSVLNNRAKFKNGPRSENYKIILYLYCSGEFVMYSINHLTDLCV